MEDIEETLITAASARKLPAAGAKKEIVKWEGKSIPLMLERGMWRLRSRSKSLAVDFNLGAVSLAEAKRLARIKLAERPAQEFISRSSLEAVAKLYLDAPKRCNLDTAVGNVSRLRAIVRAAWALELDKADIAKLPDLWPAYVAARQKSTRPDYSTRRGENVGINSAMKQAASVFIPALRPHYKRQGVTLPEDAINITWLAESVKKQADAENEKMLVAWAGLRTTNVDLWVVVGLARFAGLRQSEIAACRGGWIVQRGAASYVSLEDREEQGYQTKTGRAYLSLILHPELADYLRCIDAASCVLVRADAARWIQRGPQDWLRPFTGTAKAPLHRLRGLYADHIKRDTEQAILARQAAIQEASKNLGHTSTATTTAHYLTDDGGS